MSDERPNAEGARLRRVTVVVRSWDGPNSRIGVEMDLNQMPWGPFDALGKKLSILLPPPPESRTGGPEEESEIERALRHVEHAADRCGEFARASEGSREMWLDSQRTWEWIRRLLTRIWVQQAVEEEAEDLGAEPGPKTGGPGEETGFRSETLTVELPKDFPSMPGAAERLRATARALRGTPLSLWRDSVEADDPEAPTREEAIQTLLGLARLLEAGGRGPDIVLESKASDSPPGVREASEPEERGPAGETEVSQVSVEFAEGYDRGYRMGRKVGWALGSWHRAEARKRAGSEG
jgi:hypothetical protein